MWRENVRAAAAAHTGWEELARFEAKLRERLPSLLKEERDVTQRQSKDVLQLIEKEQMALQRQADTDAQMIKEVAEQLKRQLTPVESARCRQLRRLGKKTGEIAELLAKAPQPPVNDAEPREP
jgi:hypothetical protein